MVWVAVAAERQWHLDWLLQQDECVQVDAAH